MKTNKDEVMKILRQIDDLEYQINHHTPKEPMPTSQNDKKKAKSLWEKRLSILPEKYKEAVVEKFVGHLPIKHIEDIIPFLSWRGAEELKKKFNIDLLPIFKAWRYELAVKISSIFQNINEEVKAQYPLLSGWLRMIAEYHPLGPDWQNVKNPHLIMILSVARAVCISDDKQIISFFIAEGLSSELFKNILIYRQIEHLKGNAACDIKMENPTGGVGPGMLPIYRRRYRPNSEFPAVMGRLLNLVFRLDHAGMVQDWVKIITNPDQLALNIQWLQNKGDAKNLLAQKINLLDETKFQEQRETFSGFFQRINYSDLPLPIWRKLIKKAHTLEQPKFWFPVLEKILPSQIPKAVNREFFRMCFDFLQYLQICRNSVSEADHDKLIQWIDRVAYRSFLHLTYALFQQDLELGPEDEKELVQENFEDRYLRALSGYERQQLPSDQSFTLRGERLHATVEGLQGSGLFSATYCTPVGIILNYVSPSLQS